MEPDDKEIKHISKDFAKPLTELSRKAEEEVNHLTTKTETGSSKSSVSLNKELIKLAQNGDKSNKTASIDHAELSNTLPTTNENNVVKSKQNNTINNFLKINETLAILDRSSATNQMHNASSTSFKKNITAAVVDISSKPVNSHIVNSTQTIATAPIVGDEGQ